MAPLPPRDLDHVLAHTAGLWDEFRGQHILITGGTGFFGRWLVETFLWANQRLMLRAQVSVLTRNPGAFRASAPHLAGIAALQLVQGDIRSVATLPGEFSHIIHGAVTVRVDTTPAERLETWNTLVQGTQHILEFATATKVRSLLYISSGAVYGPQPAVVAQLAEDYPGAPDPTLPVSAYGEGKRAGEQLCALYAAAGTLQAKIARCFAFVGPQLPLDGHFAIGNFIRDALAHGPIRIAGDGTPLRSYLYAADLSIWLWTILARGQNCRAYNVGSEIPLSLRDVAGTVARCFSPSPEICVAQQRAPGLPPASYIPDVRRAQAELGLRQTIAVDDAVQRTIQWYQAQ